jgi:hypothetical protein
MIGEGDIQTIADFMSRMYGMTQHALASIPFRLEGRRPCSGQGRSGLWSDDL